MVLEPARSSSMLPLSFLVPDRMPDRPVRQELERPPFLIHARDLETARVSLAHLYGDLRIDVPHDGHRFEWRATPIDLGPVVVMSGSMTTDVILRGDVQAHTISLMAGSDARAASSCGATEIAPGRSAAVFSPGGRCEFRAAGPFRTITVRVEPLFLAAQLEALTGASPAQPLEFALPMSTALGPGALLERVGLSLTEDPAWAEQALRHPLVRTGLGELVARALRVPITKAEVQSANHSDFVPLGRGGDGTLTDPSDFGVGSFTFRLTGMDGQQVTQSFDWPAGGVAGPTLTGSKNFE